MTPPNTTGAQALSDEQIAAIHGLQSVRACLLNYANRPCDEEAAFIVKAIAAQVLALSSREQAGAAAAERNPWPQYIAGIIETYIKQNRTDEDRETGIAKIIERRLYCLAAPGATPVEQAGAVDPSDVRRFLEKLVADNRKSGAMFPQIADEIDADDEAHQRILKLINFYHPSKAAATGAATAAREQEAIKYVPVDSNLRNGSHNHPNDKEVRTPECTKALNARGDNDGQGLDGFWKWGFAAGFNAALASREEAPAASAVPNAELLRGWKRYEKLRKLTPAAFTRLHIVNVTGGNNFDDLVDALPEPSTPVPEQSAKGLTMGGEDAK